MVPYADAEEDNDLEVETVSPDNEDQAVAPDGKPHFLVPFHKLGLLQHHIAQVDDSQMASDDDVSHSGDAQSPPHDEPDLHSTHHLEGEPAGTADSDDEMDAEEEAPDTEIKKQGKKKQKKGLAVRDRINAAAAQLAHDEYPEKKRKDVSETNARRV